MVDVAGLIVIGKNTTPVSAFETSDEVTIAMNMDEIVDILLDSKAL